VSRRSARAAALDRGRPSRGVVQDAEQRRDGQADARLEPGLELGPAFRVEAEFAVLSAVFAPHEPRAVAIVEIGLGERERLVDAWPGAPPDHDQARQATAVRPGRRPGA
jgi:hypothetical protein